MLDSAAGLRGKKVLEIGSGYGTNLAVWIREFGIDGYGVEPASLGFEKSFLAPREIFERNGLEPSRIIDAQGEALPFEDACFDIVYSANVPEHTSQPAQVLREAARVLRPGGTMFMEIPNYLSYFEGHYMLPMPPVWSNRVLAAWVRLFGRNPEFVATMQFINPIRCRKMMTEVGKDYPLRLLGLGEGVFLYKLTKTYRFEIRTVSAKLGGAMRVLQTVNIGNLVGRLIVFLNGHYQIYLMCGACKLVHFLAGAENV